MTAAPHSRCTRCGADYQASQNACPNCGTPNSVELLCGHCGHLFVAAVQREYQCPNPACKFTAGLVACGACRADYWQASPACPHCHTLNEDYFVSCQVCGLYFSKILHRCPQCHTRKFRAPQPPATRVTGAQEPAICARCQHALHQGASRCPRCGLLTGTDSRAGYVYVLTHPNMPGLVKIGKTQRPTGERIAELSQQTGVPGAFLLAYEHPVSDCDAAEQSVHKHLAAYRLQDKEFFQASVQQAIEAIMQTISGCRSP